MKNFTSTLIVITLIGLFSCKKSVVNPGNNKINVDKIAPDGFGFTTSRSVDLDITLKAPNGDALSGVVVSVYNAANTVDGAAIFKGVTNSEGKLTTKVNISSTVNKLVIDPAYIGLLRYAQANINNNKVTATLGGPSVYGGDIFPAATANGNAGNTSGLTTLAMGTIYAYPSPYSSTSEAVFNTSSNPLSYGVPKYLDATADVVDQSLLSFINASVPEGKTVPQNHPEFLSSSATSTLNITTKSDVWITFVADGAANYNSLAFYTYKTGKEPKTAANIKNATLIFPNASSVGGGGGLKPGDRVKIGTFDSGTSIGFILLGNSWTGSGVNAEVDKYYSETNLNPEKNAELRKHSVVLYDDVHKLTVIGFEDVSRVTGDNDFNDLVFYAKSNPVGGISTTGVSPIDQGGDSDGDGVADALDQFPNDATKAYISYYPSQNSYYNVAFEDNWPIKGDYDMNDLVVKYRLTLESNAQNNVVVMKADVKAVAVGASFKNGFGIMFSGIDAKNVKSVTGQKLISNYIQLAANGAEAGQSNLVIIPFDNTDAVLANPDFSYFVNTLNDKYKTTNGITATVSVTMTTPAPAEIFYTGHNPFLIKNGQRGYETHLPNYAPTQKADLSLLGTGDDASVKSTFVNLYLTKEKWPWAISFNDDFVYPAERIKITDAYLHFAEWAKSGGALYPDWYSNTNAGYRNNTNLYLK